MAGVTGAGASGYVQKYADQIKFEVAKRSKKKWKEFIAKKKQELWCIQDFLSRGVIQMDWHIAFTLHGAGMESLIIR